MNYIGKVGDIFEFDNGNEAFQLEFPVPLFRFFHTPTLTTLEFVHRPDIGRLELIGLRVWSCPREACKDLVQRGKPLRGILCASWGMTSLDQDGYLTLSAADVLNAACLCLALYPDWKNRRHAQWQTKLTADAGNDATDAMRTAWLAVHRPDGSNPAQAACISDTMRHYPADVAGYRAEAARLISH